MLHEEKAIMRLLGKKKVTSLLDSTAVAYALIRDFKIQRPGRKREHQKTNRFYKQNNNCARASRFFVHFFARFCTTTTWKCLISRFTEDVNKQRRNFIYLSVLGYGPKEFNSRRVRLHLTKQVDRNNCDEDWKNANSLFKRRRWILKSPLSKIAFVLTELTRLDE